MSNPICITGWQEVDVMRFLWDFSCQLSYTQSDKTLKKTSTCDHNWKKNPISVYLESENTAAALGVVSPRSWCHFLSHSTARECMVLKHSGSSSVFKSPQRLRLFLGGGGSSCHSWANVSRTSQRRHMCNSQDRRSVGVTGWVTSAITELRGTGCHVHMGVTQRTMWSDKSQPGCPAASLVLCKFL